MKPSGLNHYFFVSVAIVLYIGKCKDIQFCQVLEGYCKLDDRFKYILGKDN